MSAATVIFTVLGYVFVLFAVAWVSGRKADNSAFFTGSRRTPWYVAAWVMIAAAMSGVTFISVPGSVAADGFSYMQMVAGFTVGQMVIAFVLIPLFYRLRVVSLYEYLDARFGLCSYRTGAWCFFISKILSAALKVYVVCTVMQLLVFDPIGWPFWVNVSATMTLVWCYTYRGGVKSLIWTDVLKTCCLLGALIVTIISIAQALQLSGDALVHEVVQSPMSRVFFFDDPSSHYYFWKMFFAGIVMLVAMTGLDQDLMQRNMSCPTPRDAQKNIVLSALCQIVVIALFLVLGVLLYAYIEHAGLPMPEKSDQVFSRVAVYGGLPTYVGILFVIGLISGTWSAAGSALTALTTSFTVDLLGAMKEGDDQRLTRTRHRVHAAVALLMALLVMCFGYWADDSVINLIYKVASYTYGPILGMFLFGLLSRRPIRDRGVPWVAIAAPILSAVMQYAAQRYFAYRIGFELLIYNAAWTMLGLFILTKKR